LLLDGDAIVHAADEAGIVIVGRAESDSVSAPGDVHGI
jgi:hypothetical protein